MFQDLEESEDVDFLGVRGWNRKIFDRTVQIPEFRRGDAGIGALMGLGDLDHERGWVDGSHSGGSAEAGRGGSEYSTTAAYV